MQNYYTEDFYEFNRENSKQSAEEIVPLVLELIPCNRVIDVGCGDGTWLKVFEEKGVEEILGIDGDYVDENTLVISKQKFISFDLRKPLQINRQFDLVLSLEVAEHLPTESAEIFVNSLTNLGSVILFSAAIPFQGGVNHVNEQWPDYWAKLFQKKGYMVVDCIRKKVWHNKNVYCCYAQNIFIFAEQNYLENNASLKKELINQDNTSASFSELSVVHPELYLIKAKMIQQLEFVLDPANISLVNTLKLLPKLTLNALQRRKRFSK